MHWTTFDIIIELFVTVFVFNVQYFNQQIHNGFFFYFLQYSSFGLNSYRQFQKQQNYIGKKSKCFHRNAVVLKKYFISHTYMNVCRQTLGSLLICQKRGLRVGACVCVCSCMFIVHAGGQCYNIMCMWGHTGCRDKTTQDLEQIFGECL